MIGAEETLFRGFMNTSLNPGAKQKLLIQAEDEITRIKSNLYFVLLTSFAYIMPKCPF